jgi:hypothetical protein
MAHQQNATVVPASELTQTIQHGSGLIAAVCVNIRAEIAYLLRFYFCHSFLLPLRSQTKDTKMPS